MPASTTTGAKSTTTRDGAEHRRSPGRRSGAAIARGPAESRAFAHGYFLSFLVAERRALRDMRRRADLVGRRVLPELRGIGLLGGPAQGRGPLLRRYRHRASDPFVRADAPAHLVDGWRWCGC